MKLTKLFAILFVLALALLAGNTQPSDITVTCDNGPAGSGCTQGQVTFTGTNYPHWVRVIVTDDQGGTLDDSIYDASAGLNVIETLDVLPGFASTTYTINAFSRNGRTQLNPTTVMVTVQ